MPKFIPIQLEGDQVQYLNLDRIRVVHDNPSEDGVRVDFDDQHRVYLDRQRAKVLLKLLQPQ